MPWGDWRTGVQCYWWSELIAWSMRHTLFKLSFEGSHYFLGGQSVGYPTWTSYPVHLRRAQTVFFTCTFSEETIGWCVPPYWGGKQRGRHTIQEKEDTRGSGQDNYQDDGEGRLPGGQLEMSLSDTDAPRGEKENKTVDLGLFALLPFEKQMHFPVWSHWPHIFFFQLLNHWHGKKGENQSEIQIEPCVKRLLRWSPKFLEPVQTPGFFGKPTPWEQPSIFYSYLSKANWGELPQKSDQIIWNSCLSTSSEQLLSRVKVCYLLHKNNLGIFLKTYKYTHTHTDSCLDCGRSDSVGCELKLNCLHL